MKICNATDPASRCAKRCPSRGKRAVDGNALNDGMPLYSLAQGPVVLREETDDEGASRFVRSGELFSIISDDH